MATYADKAIDEQIALLKDGLEIHGIHAQVEYYQEAQMLYSLKVDGQIKLIVKGKRDFAKSLAAFIRGLHFAFDYETGVKK